MFLRVMRTLMLPALVALGSTAIGCVVQTAPPPVVEDYQPAYYNGYVVYYDNGAPYYYVDGAVVWVPRTYVRYGFLVHHYRTHARAYRRWYVREGYRYKRYRHPTPHRPAHPHRRPHPRPRTPAHPHSPPRHR